MILDEYLNYLYEENMEEGVAGRIAQKVLRVLKDPMAVKQYKRAKNLHRGKLRKFQRIYTGKVAKAKEIKDVAARKARIANIKKGKWLSSAQKRERDRLVKQLKKSAEMKEKAKKVMKRRKRLKTALGVGAIGGGGFVYAKRQEAKGKSY